VARGARARFAMTSWRAQLQAGARRARWFTSACRHGRRFHAGGDGFGAERSSRRTRRRSTCSFRAAVSARGEWPDATATALWGPSERFEAILPVAAQRCVPVRAADRMPTRGSELADRGRPPTRLYHPITSGGAFTAPPPRSFQGGTRCPGFNTLIRRKQEPGSCFVRSDGEPRPTSASTSPTSATRRPAARRATSHRGSRPDERCGPEARAAASASSRELRAAAGPRGVGRIGARLPAVQRSPGLRHRRRHQALRRRPTLAFVAAAAARWATSVHVAFG